MNSDNIILNLPFDESKGSLVAYDYSQNRADGQVLGAEFVAGKNGNAISFNGGDTCEVEKSVLQLDQEFSILLWAKGGQVNTGSPQKMIWVLNFAGLDNFIEVSIEAKPGMWLSLAVTRRGSVFEFYVNSSLIRSVTNTGNLQGVSLNQDYYGGDYGLGELDDVKFYNVALTQEDMISELAGSSKIAYLIDGIDIKERYGVSVSASDGVVNRPALKGMASVSWDNYHGEAVDLRHKFYQPREITLSCFIKADSRNDFIMQVTEFEQVFDKQGTHRLLIDVHPIKPLVYEVYCRDAISVAKTWNDALMVGTFTLKLIEPEPVKRVLKHIRVGEATKTCSITLSSRKLVNIYWGDGSVDEDVSGENITITHDYETNGDFFVIVTGSIDEITSFSTNAIIVWNKL